MVNRILVSGTIARGTLRSVVWAAQAVSTAIARILGQPMGEEWILRVMLVD